MNRSPDRLELFKHRLATKLEAQKWSYRKQELEYLEAGQHLRALNQIMWQVPSMAIAVTGGLWYGVTTIDADRPKIGILLLAAIVDVTTIFVIKRLRYVIEKQIKIQRSFAADLTNKGERDRVVVRYWSILLLAASALSLGALIDVSQLSKKKEELNRASRCSFEATLDVGLSSVAPTSSPIAVNRKHIQLGKKQCP